MLRWRRLRYLACALLAGSVLPAFYLDSVFFHPMQGAQAPKRPHEAARRALQPEVARHSLTVSDSTDSDIRLLYRDSWAPSNATSVPPRPSHGQSVGTAGSLTITQLPFAVPKERKCARTCARVRVSHARSAHAEDRYTLEEGDTLGAVAAVFGVLVRLLLSALLITRCARSAPYLPAVAASPLPVSA